jgi:iron complex outermembrane receptor protein
MSARRLSAGLAAGLAIAGFASDLRAQDATADQGAGLEEVVVTARKRDESLLEVPVSVTAFTSKKIESEGIIDLKGIADFTPGFVIGNTGSEAGAEGGSHADRSTQNLDIRGVFNRASVFIDGAPIADGIVDGVDDLARVEIVKGPQSAYFGRATFIGAVNLVTKDPGDQFGGSFQALYGSYNWRDLRLSLEGPIVDQKLSARVSLRDYSMDGQYRNSGGPDSYLGAQSTESAEFDIKATPTDNLKINLYGMLWKDSDGPGVIGKYTSANWNCNAGAAPKGTLNYYCGTLPAFNLANVGMDTVIDPLFKSVILDNSSKVLSPILPNFDDHGGLERRAYHFHANINYEIESLGITVTSLTAFNQDHTEDITDIGMAAGPTINVPNPLYGIAPNMEPFIRWLFYYQDIERSDSQEFRVASDQSDRFRWTVGGNYTYSFSQYYVTQDGIFGGPLANGPGSPNDSSTIGLFFSTAYDITSDLTVNLEGRWQSDDIRQFIRTPVVPLDGESVTTLGGEKTFYNFVPRAIVQYKINPDIMAYASFSEGVSPGGFNEALITATPYQLAGLSKLIGNGSAGLTYAPEKLYNYELGIKGKLFNNRLQWSADLYYATWNNQQVEQEITIPQVNNLGQPTGGLGVVTATTNIGKTVLDGIETEGSFAVTPKFVVSWGGALNNSVIKSYSCYDPCQASITGNANVDGNLLPYYSKWSGTLSLEYDDALTDTIDWFARADYIYKSGLYDTYSDTAQTMATNRLNLHVGIRSGGTYSLEAFVLNASNDLAPTSIERNVDVLNGFGNDINVGLPLKRQVGVKGRYNFTLADEAPAPTSTYAPPPVQAPAPAIATARSYMVFFDFNKSDLDPRAAAIVDQAAANAGPAKVTQIEVTGHTDTVGSDAYNLRLSQRRAEAVAAELKARGIPSSEIAIHAKGKKDLLVPTADGVKEPRNRRVEIVFDGGATS